MPNYTQAAQRSIQASLDPNAAHGPDLTPNTSLVVTRADLASRGIGASAVAANIAAHRWRRSGTAVVLHAGPLTAAERREVALINCGPHSVLTSFTALEVLGLRGWERDEVHVLAPSGTRKPRIDEAAVRLHRTGAWDRVEALRHRRLHRVAPAALIAASSLPSARSASGLIAAAVQQRLVRPAQVSAALDGQLRLRHRRSLQLALADITQGAHALSEIDFLRLCRRFGLPPPAQQAVRTDSTGRRRYLDASWTLPDGTLLAVEVDGALHLSPRRWYADQLRQNELTLSGARILRYPSVVVRTEPELVAAQLRHVLDPLRSCNQT
jgi:hypothetical protein